MSLEVLTAGEGYALPRVFGTVLATGHLVLAKTEVPRAYHLQLGTGPWSQLRALYYRGEDITARTAEYHFHPGQPSAGFDDPVQGVDSFFPGGIPYSEVAYLAWQPGADDENPDPSQLVGVYDALILPDFDQGGHSLSPGFSSNPARAAIRLLMDANIDLSRVDWPAWVVWRDYCEQTIGWDSGQTPAHGPIKRFEAHVPFLSSLSISEALTILCDMSATVWQDDGVTIRFQPLALQVPTFTFDEDNIVRQSVAIYEIEVAQLNTHQLVNFRNLDDPLLAPASITAQLGEDTDDDIENREAPTLEYGAMYYSQAQRIGKYTLRRQLPKRTTFQALGSSFAVQTGDKCLIDHPAFGGVREIQILEIEDLTDQADARRITAGIVTEPLYSDQDHGPITDTTDAVSAADSIEQSQLAFSVSPVVQDATMIARAWATIFPDSAKWLGSYFTQFGFAAPPIQTFYRALGSEWNPLKVTANTRLGQVRFSGKHSDSPLQSRPDTADDVSDIGAIIQVDASADHDATNAPAHLTIRTRRLVADAPINAFIVDADQKIVVGSGAVLAEAATADFNTRKTTRVFNEADQPAEEIIETMGGVFATPAASADNVVVGKKRFYVRNSANARKEVAQLYAYLDGTNQTNPGGGIRIYVRTAGASVLQSALDVNGVGTVALSLGALALCNMSGPPSSPANGWAYYDTSLNKGRLYENGAWRDI